MGQKLEYLNILGGLFALLLVVFSPIWQFVQAKQSGWIYTFYWGILFITSIISIFAKNFGIFMGMFFALIMLSLLLIFFSDNLNSIFTILTIFMIGFLYTKVPIDEFKNSSNIEKVVHAVIIIVSALMIYLYSGAPEPRMKGFALVVLVLFLNTIAILYGAKNTAIAPGQKLSRVFKWFIYVGIISSIVWYNTYGTVGSYTTETVENWFDVRDNISQTPDIFPKLIGTYITDYIKSSPDRTSDEKTPEERSKESQEEERREITQEYYE